MAKILLVHGMRMPHGSAESLQKAWYRALRQCLRETEWGREHPERLPTIDDVDVAYWADLFKRPARLSGPPVATKGGANHTAQRAYYSLLRSLVRLADRTTFHDAEGRPRGPVAPFVDSLVYQAAVYMQNGPVFHPDPHVEEGAFFQVQARFEAKLSSDTRLVIGHSLGSVVAYEGLCRNPHHVDTFITVGSPIATPRLILAPLRQRLAHLLGHPSELPPPWPSVQNWLNFYTPADVWCVPVQRLAPKFGAKVRDVKVFHGSPHDFERTHKLTTYLKQPALARAIAQALETSETPDPALLLRTSSCSRQLVP